MSIFDFAPDRRVATTAENLGMAVDMPMSPFKTFMESGSNDVRQLFGLGGVIRDFETPRGLPGMSNPVEAGLASNPLTSGLVSAYETARGVLGAKDSLTPLSEDAYKASPYFRKSIPWDAGMTEDRAAALSSDYDIRTAREFFGQKNQAASLSAGLVSGLMDPINFVPIFGEAATAAAAAKFGTIAAHALMGASSAAINTAVAGYLTAPDRARYGDDVSWESSINNIGFSAFAGLAFGAIGGVFARQASIRALSEEQKIKFGAETIKALQDARNVLNDGVASYIDTGDVRLSEASKAKIEQFSGDVTDKRVAARALDTETAGVTGTKAGEVVISPGGARVAVRPEVVELSDLQHATGALQVRDRSTAASAAQIQDIALNLDPSRLMPNTDASQGAPLVGPDNVIDSGNGRVAAIRQAYAAYPDKADAYKAAVIAEHPEAADMQQPVLIQRRTTPLSDTARAQFAADANSPTTARMSAVELAQMDRALLDKPTLDTLGEGPVTSTDNRAFVARFLNNMPQNEKGALLQADGRTLSADGVRRIENALVAAAYGDVDAAALRKFAEATDDNTRSVVGALSDVAGKWLQMRRSIERGEIDPAFDQTPELTEALRKLSGWRDQAAREGRPVGTVIKEGMAQGDLLDGAMPAATKVFVRSFYTSDDFTGAVGREKIAGRLGDLVDASMKAGQPDMLGDAYAATKLGVLKGVYNDLSLDGFEAESLGNGTDGVGQARVGYPPGANREGDLGGTGTSADRAGPPARVMSDRLVAAGRPRDEADAAGAMIEAFYRTQAQRLGTTVDDLVGRFGLPEVVRASEMPKEALAQSAAPDSPELKAWFGDSKVVDGEGKPLVVYHGSPAGVPGAFDPGKIGSNRDPGDIGRGFYFSRHFDHAMAYTDGGDGVRYSDRIARVYLSIENPLREMSPDFIAAVDRRVADTPSPKALAEKDGVPAGWGSVEPTREAVEAAARSQAITDEARARGHDGIWMDNPRFGYEEIVAFDPAQIKSVDNRGTFDPADPRILFQPAYHGTPHTFDKFSLDHIGSGEGAQAYGHGLYFSSSKDVATWYRKNLAGGPRLEFDGAPLSDLIGGIGTPVNVAMKNAPDMLKKLDLGAMPEEVVKLYPDAQKYADVPTYRALALREVLHGISDDVAFSGKTLAEAVDYEIGHWRGVVADDIKAKMGQETAQSMSRLQIAEAIKKADILKATTPGRLLTVDVPDEHELLNWDKPLSEQSPHVKEALAKLGVTGDDEAIRQRLAEINIEKDVMARDRDPRTNIMRDEKGWHSLSREAEKLQANLEAVASGRAIYDRLGSKAAGVNESGRQNLMLKAERDALASKALRETGIPGHTYIGHESGKANFVIYDDSRVNVTSFEQPARGAITFGDDGHSVISIFENADASTALHEAGHHFLSMFKSMAERPDAPAQLAGDWETVKAWWKDNADAVAADSPTPVTAEEVRAVLTDGTTGDRIKDLGVNIGLQEQWARGFESYLRDGQAPTEGLRGAFAQFKAWLQAIYRSVQDLNVKLSPEVRDVFDRMLGGEGDQPGLGLDTPQQPARPTIDMQEPRPIPPPDGLDAAAARVGKSEDIRGLAEQFGVNPDGTFLEQADIEALRSSGRLTVDDQAMLDAAKQNSDNAEAYGEALRAAAACIAG